MHERRTWLRAGASLALLTAMLGAVGGCEGLNGLEVGEDDLVEVPEGKLSLYQFAERLGLVVAKSARTHATLTNSGHTVLVFADPDGQVMVSGKPAGPAGGIKPHGDTLFLPAGLVPPVRAALARGRIPHHVQPPPVRPHPKPKRLGPVVLDPGHGGRDPGATAASGLREKDVNLSVALMAAQLLRRRGVQVTMTRSSDVFIELNDRAAVADGCRARLFVSLHADAHADRRIRGFTLYAARAASTESLAAADTFVRRMCATGTRSQGVRRADFRVLVRTSCPAVLVEMGYLSNPTEAARLSNERHQRRLAEAVADAVMDVLQEV